MAHPNQATDLFGFNREERRVGVQAIDVASYILKKCGTIPAMKLHKLVYYSQAWSLVWDDKPVFHDRIEAWANGPVVRSLYNRHKGRFRVGSIRGGDWKLLDPEQRETIDAVLDYYGDKSSQWLSDLTHMEAPWQEARAKAGLASGQRGNACITHASMAEYYSGL